MSRAPSEPLRLCRVNFFGYYPKSQDFSEFRLGNPAVAISSVVQLVKYLPKQTKPQSELICQILLLYIDVRSTWVIHSLACNLSHCIYYAYMSRRGFLSVHLFLTSPSSYLNPFTISPVHHSVVRRQTTTLNINTVRLIDTAAEKGNRWRH